jgi:hypothetical protein
MKNSLRGFLVIIFFIFFSFISYGNSEDEKSSSMNLRCDLYSRYFYRGFDYNLGKPAFQPNLYYSHPSGFEFNLFTSFGLDKKTEFDEFDLTGKYNFSLFENLSAFIGTVGIFFPNTQSIPTNNGKFDYTYELQTGLNYKLYDFSFSLLYAHDFKNADGDCIDINGSYSLGLSERVSLIPVLGAVYQSEYGFTGSFRNKFTALYLYLPFEINMEKITLIPSYNISYIPSEQMRKTNELYEAGYKEFLQFIGVSMKYNF